MKRMEGNTGPKLTPGSGAARSSQTTIKFQGNEPTKAHNSDSGFDLFASESRIIPVGQTAVIKTGLRMAIPAGHVGLVCSRSGLAAKRGVFVLNSPGIIDPGYRGEVGVVLHNSGAFPFQVSIGERLAQLLIVKLATVTFKEADDLGDSERGMRGFGSTGA